MTPVTRQVRGSRHLSKLKNHKNQTGNSFTVTFIHTDKNYKLVQKLKAETYRHTLEPRT